MSRRPAPLTCLSVTRLRSTITATLSTSVIDASVPTAPPTFSRRSSTPPPTLRPHPSFSSPSSPFQARYCCCGKKGARGRDEASKTDHCPPPRLKPENAVLSAEWLGLPAVTQTAH
ncbi:hypothetical protein DPEC_G00241720 [Dallia pectoralis]|uniref:Uncharacterized protein n=1 Tax=Dallia pectoralis TaxID=75939 RepID=A0ACC2FUU0_DALPE|nr:hypothetical protein DPEC_G00241720 [Dallia pectoralis]